MILLFYKLCDIQKMHVVSAGLLIQFLQLSSYDLADLSTSLYGCIASCRPNRPTVP